MSSEDSSWFIADPIHQTLDLGGGLLKQLTAAPEFQRLRRISQLGLASYVYPGAVHTRFNHCLGAAHLARRVMDRLRESVSDSEPALYQGMVECAALLHDIGHGPFSHSFERALGKVLHSVHGNKALTPKHEDWTKSMVSRLSLGPELEAGVLGLITHDDVGPSKLPVYLRQVISSQLDVDRMDYVARDAHFSGIPTGVDLHYLIKSLRIVSHSAAYRTLGLATKGVRSYEAFAFARHTLYRTLYRHKKVAVFECMMERCLSLLVGGVAERQNIRLPRFFEKLRLMAGTWNSKAELVSELTNDYIALTEDDIWVMVNEAATSGGDEPLARLARRLVQRDPVKYHLVRYGMGETLETILREGALDEHADVVPLKSLLYEHEPKDSDRIFLSDGGSSTVKDITEVSPVVEALRDRAETEHLLIAWDREDEVLARAGNCLTHDERPSRRSTPPGKRHSTPPSPPMAN
jgi:uncharacterized protein